MDCCINPYTLPTIEFVGGSAQELLFHVYWHSLQNPFDLTNYSANFAIVDFRNRRGTTIISKPMTIVKTGMMMSGVLIYNLLKVKLTSLETVDLEGKFIYQISIKENGGDIEVPNQGIMYIENNINKRYITG